MRNKIIKKTSYIDTDTGEIKEKRTILDNVYQDNDFVLMYNHIKFTMCDEGKFAETIGYFNIGIFYTLVHYLDKNNFLMYKGKPLKKKDLEEICKISNHKCGDFFKVMESSGVIKQIKYKSQKYYIVNPLYAVRGKRTTYLCYSVFKQQLRKFDVYMPRNIEKYDKEYEIL